jgi:hypothetical protein
MKSSNIKYISKRLVERKSKKAFKVAAKMAMTDNGYVVIVKDGWVVKEFSNGEIERIEKLAPQNLNQELILD